MSLREIHNELKSDYSNVVTKKDLFFKEFRRNVLKASNFPFTRSREYTTPIKKNLFIITFSAPSRGYENKPEFSAYVIYNTVKGKYLASLIIQHDIITIYAPHFFKRFRERILNDNSITNDEIIRNYIKKDRGFTGGFLTRQVEDCFKSFEEQHQDEPVNFAAATLDGFCFGFKDGNNIMIKTIISTEMVKDDQRKLFTMLKNQFEEENL